MTTTMAGIKNFRLDEGSIEFVEKSKVLKQLIEDFGHVTDLRLEGIAVEQYDRIIELFSNKITLDDLTTEELEDLAVVIDKYDIEQLSGINLIIDERNNRELEDRLRTKLIEGEELTEEDRSDYAFDLFDQTWTDFKSKKLSTKCADQSICIPGLIDPNNRTPFGDIVNTYEEFKQNFDHYTRNLFVDFDWSGVAIAGGLVLHSLKKEQFLTSSDIDMFLYGLTYDEAIEKIKYIIDYFSQHYLVSTFAQASTRRNSFLEDIASEHNIVFAELRTKYVLTLWADGYRPVQIVFRLSKYPEEVILGFDLDCVKFLYDGERVITTNQAYLSVIYSYNLADGDRQIFRTGTYERRLRKYYERGFNIRVPGYTFDKLAPELFFKPAISGLGVLIKMIVAKTTTVLSIDDDGNYNMVQGLFEYGDISEISDILTFFDKSQTFIFIIYSSDRLTRTEVGRIEALGDQLEADNLKILSVEKTKPVMFNGPGISYVVENKHSVRDKLAELSTSRINLSENIVFIDSFKSYAETMPDLPDWYAGVYKT